MWQKCPICKGQGFVFNAGTVSEITSTCPTCKGQRIISKKTGEPPLRFYLTSDKQETSITCGDYAPDVESFTTNDGKTKMSQKRIELGSTSLPEWANWVAMDKHDIWFCYEKEPDVLDDYWRNQKGSRCMQLNSSSVLNLGVSCFQKDYKESLYKLRNAKTKKKKNNKVGEIFKS